MSIPNSKYLKIFCAFYSPLLWASVVLFCLSLYFPVFINEQADYSTKSFHGEGILMLLLGFCSAGSSSFFSYGSNIAYIILWASFYKAKIYKFSYFKLFLILYAPLAALWFPFSKVPLNEGGHIGAVKEVYSGYYLWTASMFLMSLSAIARILKTKFAEKRISCNISKTDIHLAP